MCRAINEALVRVRLSKKIHFLPICSILASKLGGLYKVILDLVRELRYTKLYTVPERTITGGMGRAGSVTAGVVF